MIWLLACAPPDDPGVTSPLTAAPPEAARVVIVVLDGVRVEESVGTPGADHPSLTGEPPEAFLPEVYATLLPEAAVLYGARNIGVTTTYDAHVELLTGLRQPLVTFPTGESGLWRSEAPTLFEAARRAEGLAEDQVLLMGNTPLLEELTWGLWPGMGPEAAASWRFRTDADAQDLRDAQVVEDLVAWLGVHDTRLAVVNLHRMDLAGHIEPDLSYIDRIRQADPAVAGLWRWLSDTPPYAGNTTLIVMADHGRHRTDLEADAWRNHGDQCDGCRSIPLIVAGPGVAPGAQPDPGLADPAAPATLADIGATAAWRLGVPLPLGRGRVLTELFDASFPGLAGAVPQAGAGAISAAGGAVVREEGAGLAGAVVTPEGVHAEAPVIAAVETAAGGAILACWRELGVDGGGWSAGTWAARCSADGQDTGFPTVEGSADWEGALLADPAGGAWLGWVHNPAGDAGAPLVRPRIARWSPDSGWQTDALSPPEISYPTRPSLARDPSGAGLRFAAATSDGESTGRDSRSVTVWSVDAGQPQAQRWTQLLQIRPDGEFLRMDRPALRPDGGALAWLGIDGAGGVSALIQGDPGAGMGARTVAGSGVIALTGLRWMEEGGDWSLVWARVGAGGTVEAVRWDGRERVIATGLPWVAGLALTEGGVMLSGPDGVETFLF